MADKKSAGYHGSFVDFVGQCPQESAKENKADDTDDDDDDKTSGNSGNTAPEQENSNDDDMPVRRPGTAKRGRLRGPKCAQKRPAKSDSDASSSCAPVSGNEKDDDDVEPPAVPRRVRTTRAAKVKATQKGRTIIGICHSCFHWHYCFKITGKFGRIMLHVIIP